MKKDTSLRKIMKALTHSRLTIPLLVLMLAGHAGSANAQMEVTFTGNNGVMLSGGGGKVLIDALWNHLDNFWTRLESADVTKLVNGDAPFDGVSYAMTTHNHPDHFNAGTVLGFLTNNPSALLIAPPQARGVFNNFPQVQSQVLDITPAFQTESIVVNGPGVEIEVFHMEHFDQFGNDFSNVQDFTYLVTMGGVSLLHLGDVDYIPENFANFDFASREIDAVVLPTFNTLLSEDNKQVILDQINPKHIIATHLRAGVLVQEEANVRALYPDATIFTSPFQSIVLTAIPEPSTVMISLVVFLGLVGRRNPRGVCLS